MASPELAIAKAALSASLFRADPTSTSRPSIDSFLQLINSTLSQCSRPNVQNCKDYIVSNISLSSGRTTALAKYLVALSRSQVETPRPSPKRRRLHILYIASDALHHLLGQREFSAAWEPFLPALFASASASAPCERCPKHRRKLEDLISLWKERNYVSADAISKLTAALSGGAPLPPTDAPVEPAAASLRSARELPFVLPSSHGDPATPWYDLPAATWLPHLVPNSTKPMLPEMIKPVQLAPGPADKVIAAAVKALLSDAERLFLKEDLSEQEGIVDINELGERVVLDEITGEILSGETYYGWSRQFCQRMKARKKGVHSRGCSYSRSRSPSGDRSYSRGRRRNSSSRSLKRRRLSPSTRSSSRSRSRSRSRSPSPSPSPSRSRSRSPRSYTSSRSRSRDRYSPSPARHQASQQAPQQAPQQAHPPPPLPPLPSSTIPSSIPIPPPPAGYQGPWPPPPPPLPPNMNVAPQGWVPHPAFAAQIMGAWNQGQAPPPPPSPQQHFNNYNNSLGHDNGGYRGRGRGHYRGGGGGYGRGR